MADPSLTPNRSRPTRLRPDFGLRPSRGTPVLDPGRQRDSDSARAGRAGGIHVALGRRACRRPVLDEDTLMAAVGDETAAILRAARSAATEVRNRAAADADRIVAEAHELGAGLRSEAESVLSRETTAAQAAAGQILDAAVRGGPARRPGPDRQRLPPCRGPTGEAAHHRGRQRHPRADSRRPVAPPAGGVGTDRATPGRPGAADRRVCPGPADPRRGAARTEPGRYRSPRRGRRGRPPHAERRRPTSRSRWPNRAAAIDAVAEPETVPAPETTDQTEAGPEPPRPTPADAPSKADEPTKAGPTVDLTEPPPPPPATEAVADPSRCHQGGKASGKSSGSGRNHGAARVEAVAHAEALTTPPPAVTATPVLTCGCPRSVGPRLT